VLLVKIDPKVMLQYYKEQSIVERGFKFIKDKSFPTSEFYLENENRIAFLVMIMVLCLLFYYGMAVQEYLA
jgi:transposase